MVQLKENWEYLTESLKNIYSHLLTNSNHNNSVLNKQNEKIHRLGLYNCYRLQNLDGLAKCTNLTELYLNKCINLRNVDVLSKLTNLTVLNLKGCRNLKNKEGLRYFKCMTK